MSVRRVIYVGLDDHVWDDLSRSLAAESIDAVRVEVEEIHTLTTYVGTTGVVVLGPMATAAERLLLCRRVRLITTAPISIIAGELSEADQLRLVSAGACRIEDQPIRSRVLAAQFAVHLGAGDVNDEMQVLEYRSISLNVVERLVIVGGSEVTLTKTEFELLARLMENSRRVYTHAELARWLWRDEWGADHRRLEAHVSRLRKKVIAAGGPIIIDSVRGVGYRLGLEGRVGAFSRAAI